MVCAAVNVFAGVGVCDVWLAGVVMCLPIGCVIYLYYHTALVATSIAGDRAVYLIFKHMSKMPCRCIARHSCTCLYNRPPCSLPASAVLSTSHLLEATACCQFAGKQNMSLQAHMLHHTCKYNQLHGYCVYMHYAACSIMHAHKQRTTVQLCVQG
jgi:hypothetical protein